MKQELQYIREKILYYGIPFLIALLPLLFFSERVSPHISSKTFFLYGSISIVGPLWIYSLFVDTTYRWSRKQILWTLPIFFFLVWMTLAGVFAINSHLAFWSSFGRGTGLLTWYSAFIVLGIIISLRNKYGTKWHSVLFRLLTVSTSILALSIWFGDEGIGLPYVVFQKASGGGLIGNSSLAAAYAFFAFGALAFSYVQEKSSVWKKYAIGVAVLLATSPIFFNVYGGLSGKSFLGSARGGILGICVMLGSTALVYFLFSKRSKVRAAAIAGIIVSISLFVYGWGQLTTPNTYLNQKFIESASGTRFIFWEKAQKAMDERPWVGYGPENYMIAFQRYFDPRMLTKEFNNEAWNDRAHNIYFDMGAQAGYPGLILYAGMLLALIVCAGVLVRAKKIQRLEGAIVIGVIVGYVFQNLFVFDSATSIVGLFVLYAWVLSAVDSEGGVQKEKNTLSEGYKVIIGGLLVIVGIYGWYTTAYTPSRKALLIGRAFSAPLNKKPAYYPLLLQGSRVGEDWDISGLAHDAFRLYTKNALPIKSDKMLLSYVVKDLEALLPYLEKVAERNTTDFRLQLKIIHLYSTYLFLLDKPLDTNLADHILKYGYNAQKLAPNEPEAYWAIGQISVWKGDFAQAQSAYENAVLLDKTLSSSWQGLLGFYQGVGDKKSYENTLEQARKYIPDFKPE